MTSLCEWIVILMFYGIDVKWKMYIVDDLAPGKAESQGRG
jgi:hypothetical protein